MKKVLLSIVLFILPVTFTACSNGEANVGILRDNDEYIADKTFNKIISAIRLKDDSEIVGMFSDVIKSENNLSETALTFVNYIDGDIVSFTSASEAGVGADYKAENAVYLKDNTLPDKSVIYRYKDGQWCRAFLEEVYKTKRPPSKDKQRRYTEAYLFDCLTFYEELIYSNPSILTSFDCTGNADAGQ